MGEGVEDVFDAGAFTCCGCGEDSVEEGAPGVGFEFDRACECGCLVGVYRGRKKRRGEPGGS